MINPDHISKSLETIFWVKILIFFYAYPGWTKFGSGIEKIRIRDGNIRIRDGKNSEPGSGMEKFESGIRDGKNSDRGSSPECLRTSSARILLRMNSASLATRTMWSFMAWERRRPSLMSSMKASPACFCSEFCHSWNRNPYSTVLLTSLLSVFRIGICRVS